MCRLCTEYQHLTAEHGMHSQLFNISSISETKKSLYYLCWAWTTNKIMFFCEKNLNVFHRKLCCEHSSVSSQINPGCNESHHVLTVLSLYHNLITGSKKFPFIPYRVFFCCSVLSTAFQHIEQEQRENIGVSSLMEENDGACSSPQTGLTPVLPEVAYFAAVKGDHRDSSVCKDSEGDDEEKGCWRGEQVTPLKKHLRVWFLRHKPGHRSGNSKLFV